MPAFRPILAGAQFGDRLRAGLGAACGILFTGLIAALATHAGSSPLLVAPIGASAVLVFAVPASPLAQPWSVIGGNTVSGLWALLVVALVPHTALAAAIAVGGAIVVMSLARCLHPPGGAVALSVVLLTAAPRRAGAGVTLHRRRHRRGARRHARDVRHRARRP